MVLKIYKCYSDGLIEVVTQNCLADDKQTYPLVRVWFYLLYSYQ